MSGLFGGLLLIVGLTGGCVLFLLVGWKAWNDGRAAYYFRLATGTYAVGVLLGTVFIYLYPPAHSLPPDWDSVTLIFGAAPAAVGCVIAILEFIRNILEKSWRSSRGKNDATNSEINTREFPRS